MTGQVTSGFPNIYEIWVYLSGSPLLALILTLGAYQLGVIAYERANRHPLANPVLIAIVLVAATITLIDMPYPKYFEGAQFVHFLLGTATVSLAVPIYKGLSAMRGRILPLLAALLAGGVTSIASAVGIATLTAVFAVSTGILGAVLARFVLDAVRSREWWQRGFAIGVAAHGLGTSRAFSVNAEAGAYSSLAMGLHGVLGAVLIPLGVRILGF
jgi:putative effector of murein hydrolase